MITTLWDSAVNSPNQNSPYQTSNPGPQALAISSSAATTSSNPSAINPAVPGQKVVQIDLGSVQNIGDVVSLELEVLNPAGSAPASATTLTMYAAFSSSGSKQPVELLPSASNTPCTMSTVKGQTQVFMNAQLQMCARYLYVWFAYSGDSNNAVPLGLRLRVNGQTG